MYMAQDFHVTSFLTSYFIDSQVSFRIFYFIYGIWQFVSELIEYVYKYTKIKGLDWTEITSLPESKKSDEHGMSFRSSLKMKQGKFMSNQLATPSAPLIRV